MVFILEDCGLTARPAALARAAMLSNHLSGSGIAKLPFFRVGTTLSARRAATQYTEQHLPIVHMYAIGVSKPMSH